VMINKLFFPLILRCLEGLSPLNLPELHWA